ncbi:MAG: hypothetical protein K2H97_10715 [Prevotella sp.]|nr:hypothetical protein [Prevotella sp.]
MAKKLTEHEAVQKYNINSKDVKKPSAHRQLVKKTPEEDINTYNDFKRRTTIIIL